MSELIGVKFRKGGELSPRNYTYYANEDYEIGEVIEVPVGKGVGSAVVVEKGMRLEDVPEYLRPFLKEVPKQAKVEPFAVSESALGLEDVQ